jgi:hypothetical protein
MRSTGAHLGEPAARLCVPHGAMGTAETHCIDAALIRAAEISAGALKRVGLTVVTAESCTAGLIAAALSQAEGATGILHGGFVTYTKAHRPMHSASMRHCWRARAA